MVGTRQTTQSPRSLTVDLNSSCFQKRSSPAILAAAREITNFVNLAPAAPNSQRNLLAHYGLVPQCYFRHELFHNDTIVLLCRLCCCQRCFVRAGMLTRKRGMLAGVAELNSLLFPGCVGVTQLRWVKSPLRHQQARCGGLIGWRRDRNRLAKCLFGVSF